MLIIATDLNVANPLVNLLGWVGLILPKVKVRKHDRILLKNKGDNDEFEIDRKIVFKGNRSHCFA